ncbi:tetraspanin-17-like, partial [Centruroides sculpturatus]|uniref:tetraspanin-17-like n=1 Tax=Centruroides sculpturatus TaxID=218467 RepID=UPI000C6E08FB
YAIFLAILLLLEMTAGILGFIFKDWIKSQATGGFQAFIIHYREDPDQQNLIDWIQEQWLECCGIEGPKDWDMNIYFNCSSIEVGSREACGVPFSCCKPQPNEIIKNKQCGYDVRKSEYFIHPDQQNLIDWIQEQWLECCGIEGPKDWDMNIYFNCSSIEVGSREACGVPFSCCKPQPNEIIKNKQCGYDVRKSEYSVDKSAVIYEKGCLRAGEEWIEANLVPVAGVAVAVAVLQILGICFAQNLRADIFAQKAKWQ